nr:MAG TPA: hypothetical protein [Caudoviricetes sp.]
MHLSIKVISSLTNPFRLTLTHSPFGSVMVTTGTHSKRHVCNWYDSDVQ